MAKKRVSNRSTTKQAADDRNLVEISSDSPNISFEDRVYLWWKENSRIAYLLIVLLILGIAGWYAAHWYKQAHELKIQEEFMEAKTTEEREDFTQRYPEHVLSGVIWKELGDQAYDEKEYGKAVAYFEKAIPVLAGVAKWYANLGLGVSQLQLEDPSQGIQTLQELAYTPSISKEFRAQAFWQLAIHYWQAQDYKSLISNLDNVTELDEAGAFTQLVESIRSTLPESVLSH